MITATNAYYSGPVAGGLTELLAVLGRAGATTLGAEEAPRVPIADAVADPTHLEMARTISVAGPAWTAVVTTAPMWSVSIDWGAADVVPQAIAVLDELAALGALDFGTSHQTAVTAPVSVDDYRALAVCREAGGIYRREGPMGLGFRSIVGKRLLELGASALQGHADTELRSDGMLAIGGAELAAAPDRWRALVEAFAATGVAAQIADAGGRFRATRGPAFKPLPELFPPRPRSKPAIELVRALQASEHGAAATDLEAKDVVAPFSQLRRVRAEDVELEGAVLSYSLLYASQLQDVGLVGADLRGVSAREVHWVDVALVNADLRWADLERAELPACDADDGDWSHANLAGARGPESAQRTNFDDVTADGWQPGPRAQLAGATFRDASLRGADFTAADLKGAIFDGADLTKAIFRDADLSGASLRGCTMTDVDLTGATTAGATLPT